MGWDITGRLAGIADAVKVAGDQTIEGIKTFSEKIVVPDGTFSMSAILGLAAEFAKYAKFANSVKFVTRDPVTGVWPASFDPVTSAPVYTNGKLDESARPTSSDSCLVIYRGVAPQPKNWVASGTGGPHSIDVFWQVGA